MKNLETIISNRKVRITLSIVGVIILALLVFHAGVVVGSHRGLPSRDNANRGAMNRGFRSSFLPNGFELPHGSMQNGHGAVGTITTVALPELTIDTREGVSTSILVSTSTLIRNMSAQNDTRFSVGDKIIVLGEADSQGRITAKIINVFPK